MNSGLGDFAEIDPDRVLEQAREQAAKIANVQRELSDLVGEARSPDGYVKACFTASGGLTELELNPRVMRMASADLADLVKATVRGAAADLQAKINAKMGEMLGDLRPSTVLDDPAKALSAVHQAQDLLDRTTNDAMTAMDDIRRRLGL